MQLAGSVAVGKPEELTRIVARRGYYLPNQQLHATR